MGQLNESEIAELRRLMFTQHEAERQKLADNEAFVIGMLQAVCAATSFGIVSQFETITSNAGRLAVLVVLSELVLGLALAVAAAFCRHHYKMWDVKAAVADKPEEKDRRVKLMSRYLGAMRQCMVASTILTVGAMLLLVAAFWASYLR